MNDPFIPIQRDVQAQAVPVDSAAAAGVGNAIAGLGNQAEDFDVAHEQAVQQKNLSVARLGSTKDVEDLRDQFRTDTDPDTMATRFNDAAQKIGEKWAGTLQGRAADAFTTDFGMIAQSQLRNIKDVAFDRQREQVVATVDDTGETASRGAAFSSNGAERNSYISTYKQSVDGAVSTGMMSAEQGQKKFQVFNERLALFDGKRDVILNPKAAFKNLDNPDYLPSLDPISREELKNSADAEIRVREREARQALQMARLQASQDASDLHESIASGEPVAQSVVDTAVQSAHASGDAKAMLRVAGLVRAKGFADGLRGAAPRDVDAGLAAIETQANKTGIDASMAAALAAARAFKEKQTSGLAHDPLMYGASQGAIALKPLQLNGSDTPADFAGRLAQRKALTQRYGVDVPPLTQAESETLKTRLGPDQDANLRLGTLRTVVSGFGAAAPAVLGKLGASDPTMAAAGALVAAGPAYIGSARDILTGQQLLHDKANEGLRPTPAAKNLAEAGNLMSAYSTPSLVGIRAAVLDGADAIFAANAVRQGLRGADLATPQGKALYQKSLQQAAGARFEADGSQWGGIGNYRGNSVLVPQSVKADGFEDLVHHLQPDDLTKASVNGQPPVFEGGTAPSSLMQKPGLTGALLGHHGVWLISGGNGVYGLSATDPNKGATTPVKDKSGAPFRFRFGTALAVMQARTAKAGP